MVPGNDPNSFMEEELFTAEDVQAINEQQPEVVQQQEAAVQPEPQEEVQQEQQPVKEVTVQENSMRRMREAKERAERERDEVLRRLEAIERKANPQQEVQDFNLEEDDFVSGKHYSAQSKKIADMHKQIESIAAESRLRSQYPDFDSVMNPENIAMLKETYPELAYSIGVNSDPYTQQASAYTIIKKLGIYKDEIQVATQNKIKQNISKPRPSASIIGSESKSPLDNASSYADPLSREAREKRYREMKEFQKKADLTRTNF